MGVKHITHSGNCCNVCFLIISGHLKTNTETKYYVDVYSIWDYVCCTPAGGFSGI